MKHIETPRLLVRDFTLEDAADLHEIFGDAETMRNCEPAYDFEKTKAFLVSFCIGRRGALAAVEQGLQCCWLGAFDAPAVREILAVPEDYVIVALSTLGYPGDDKAAPAKKTVEEIVSCNRFGEA